MLRPQIDWTLCQICETCASRPVCKVRAVVKLDPDEAPYIDLSRCNGCGNCIPACPHGAICLLNKNSPKNGKKK